MNLYHTRTLLIILLYKHFKWFEEIEEKIFQKNQILNNEIYVGTPIFSKT